MRLTDLPRPRAAGALLVGFALALLFLLAALGFAPANASSKNTFIQGSGTPDFDWAQRLRPGQTLEVRGVNGAIQARAASGSEARVTAFKTGKTCDPDEVKIEVSETEEGIVVCARYPNSSGSNSCGDDEHGWSDDDDDNEDDGEHHKSCDVSVHFKVEVPDGVKLELRTVNGEIDVTEVEGEVDAQTVNGSVRVETTDLARAQTVNGSIDVHMGRAKWEGDLDFQTVNGSITLHAPPRLTGRIDAKTMNGRIESDFPMTTSGSVTRRRVSGSIGEGGRGRLRMETLNGSIYLVESR